MIFELPEDFNANDYIGHKDYHPSDDWDFEEREALEHEEHPSIITYKLNRRNPK